jgi:tetratricopeptide (TPR) repeat protein
MASAILSLLFCLTTPVVAQKDEEAASVAPKDEAAALAARAAALRKARKYSEAVLLEQQVLAIREKQLGPDHPNVALSLFNLADLYRTQGHYADAESLYNRSLAIWE